MSLSHRHLRAITTLKPPWVFEVAKYPQLSWLNLPDEDANYKYYLSVTNNISIASSVGSGDSQTIFKGVALEIVSALARLANAKSFELLSDDEGGGRLLPNNTWTGIFGMLQRGEVDLIAETYIVTSQRLADFMFTTPLEMGQVYAVFSRHDQKEHEGLTTNLLSIFKPFEAECWIMILIFAIFCSLLIVVFEYCEHLLVNTRRDARFVSEEVNVEEQRTGGRYIRDRLELDMGKMLRYAEQQNADRYKISLFVGLFSVYGSAVVRTLLQRDLTFMPLQCASTTILSFWSLFSLIVMSLYPAELFAIFAVKPQPVPIFHDFVTLRDAGYRVIVGQNDASSRVVQEIIRQTNGTDNGKALQDALVDKSEWAPTYADLLAKVRGPNSHYVTFWPRSFYERDQTADCALQALPLRYRDSEGTERTLPAVYMSMTMRREDHELAKVVDTHMAWLRQCGMLSAIMDRHAKMWSKLRQNVQFKMVRCNEEFYANTEKASQVINNVHSERQSLGIRQVASSFVLNLAGLVTAALCWVAEVILYAVKT